MLTRWLTFTAFLAGSANPERAAIGQSFLTVAPTCRVKGHPEVELTLNCGDRKNAGVVQYWHTPFGDLQMPGFHSKLAPVFMHHDGSLVVPNSSVLHSGLYYCLLQHTEGTTLWPYELHVGRNSEKNQEPSRHKQCGAFRFRRDVGSVEEKQAGVSDGQFAGAVAASVLLTFVLGFSAGALARTHVLRCLGAVTTRLRSQRQQRWQTDEQDHGCEVTMTTLPPMYENQAFEMEQVLDDDNSATMSTSSATSSPPAKPQRSFRQKRQEEQESTAYLEGCDYMKEEESKMEEEVARGSVKEKNKGCDGEAEEEEREFYPTGEDGGSQTDTDEDECSEDGEERDGRESREEKEWRQEDEEVEEAGEQERRSKEDGEERRGSEEAGGNREKGRDERREEEGEQKRREEGEQERREEEGEQERREEEGEQERREEDGEQERREEEGEQERREEEGEQERREEEGEQERREEDGETDICSKDDETSSENQEDTIKTGIMEGGGQSSSSPGRRRRVIRLYQYDEDGQRYGHLPDPAPDEPGPTPRLKQRSLSLTRLNAIMAAASAGPLDTRETGREETGERPRFHIDI